VAGVADVGTHMPATTLTHHEPFTAKLTPEERWWRRMIHHGVSESSGRWDEGA